MAITRHWEDNRNDVDHRDHDGSNDVEDHSGASTDYPEPEPTMPPEDLTPEMTVITGMSEDGKFGTGIATLRGDEITQKEFFDAHASVKPVSSLSTFAFWNQAKNEGGNKEILDWYCKTHDTAHLSLDATLNLMRGEISAQMQAARNEIYKEFGYDEILSLKLQLKDPNLPNGLAKDAKIHALELAKERFEERNGISADAFHEMLHDSVNMSVYADSWAVSHGYNTGFDDNKIASAVLSQTTVPEATPVRDRAATVESDLGIDSTSMTAQAPQLGMGE